MKFPIGSISVLLHMPIASTCRCVENMSLRVSFFGSFWVSQKNLIQAFSNFLRYYTPFVFTCLLEVCLDVFPRAAEFVRPSGLFFYHFCYQTRHEKGHVPSLSTAIVQIIELNTWFLHRRYDIMSWIRIRFAVSKYIGSTHLPFVRCLQR